MFRKNDDDDRWLSNKRLGRPHACKAGTIERMEADGFKGVYLTENVTPPQGSIEIPTPPELMEPKIDGQNLENV